MRVWLASRVPALPLRLSNQPNYFTRYHLRSSTTNPCALVFPHTKRRFLPLRQPCIDGYSPIENIYLHSEEEPEMPAYYAVRAGTMPGVYNNWDDVKAQTSGFKNAIFKKFDTRVEAEKFMKGDNSSVPKPGKSSKFYGVKAGHAPGVYTDWPSVQEQITGYKGSKHKSFATLAEAQAFVNESKRTTPSEASASISLKGHLDTSTLSVADTQRPSKKLKRNDGAAMVPAIKDEYEPGFGPLPPDAEDGFDRTIKLHPTGLVHKSEAELNRHKKQPTGDFEGELNIWTDGAARGNGKVGCLAGIGIWFGAHDSRNVSEPLLLEGRQTNQRAELAAIARAMDITPIDRDVKIMTDSFYSIQCLTVWCKNWKTNGWKNSAGKPVENKDIIEPILARIRERDLCKAKTNFQWVKGHGTDVGNIGADHLATTGALKDRSVQYPEPLKVPVDGVQDLKPTGDQ